VGPARVAASLILAAAFAACSHSTPKPIAAAPSPQPARGAFHVVKTGETLFRISQMYGVPVATLARENDLADLAQINVGQRIYVPHLHTRAQSLEPRGQLEWPVRGVIFSPFGPRPRDRHDGIDLAAPEGTPVVAAESGTALFVGQQRGYGNLILLGHDNDVVTVYAHNQRNLIERGQRVTRGTVIARVGRSGNATGPHLHFEVRVAARPRNPLEFLR
jgi:murein DD-endopeptidase MepM/ murein hydrolase activator NlpD